MQLYIKKIMCDHCATTVENLLVKSGVNPISVRPEKIVLAEKALTGKQLTIIKVKLEELGFELIDEVPGRMVEQIKEIIMNLIHFDDREKRLDVNFSAYLSYELGKSYPQISHIFSTIEGITIKQFIIQQKVERVKEMLDQNYTLSKVAARMNYSSIQHLCAQFKKITGLTPVQYKQQFAHKETIPVKKTVSWQALES